jgi:Tol biopolymer transport system component
MTRAEIASARKRGPGPGRGLRLRGLAVLGLVALALLAGGARAAKNDVDLVSRASGASGTRGNGDSYADSVSADGRFVVFDSAATNLSPDDSDGFTDVYVRDLQTNTTTLVSRAGGVSGAKGNGNSGAPAISADGRFVAFTSDAMNLSPDDGDTTSDVYVRDLQTNTTTLVSRASGVAGAKGRLSFAPAISADGRFVAFYSFTRLSPDDGDAIFDAYVRDLQTNTTTLASRASGAGGAKGNGNSWRPAISADGRFVAFRSGATNLSPDDGDATEDVFVRDLQANTTTLVSRATGPAAQRATTPPKLRPGGPGTERPYRPERRTQLIGVPSHIPFGPRVLDSRGAEHGCRQSHRATRPHRVRRRPAGRGVRRQKDPRGGQIARSL